MTHEKFEGERTLMRIHIGESDKWHGRPLHEAIVEMLRKDGFSGATVLRGVGGYGGSSVYHTDKLLRLSQDLPIILEVIESQERIEAILPPASTKWSKAASSHSKKSASSSTAPRKNNRNGTRLRAIVCELATKCACKQGPLPFWFPSATNRFGCGRVWEIPGPAL